MIANNASGTAVTKRDTGTWSLTAANTYTGTTTVTADTLRANAQATNHLLNGVGGVDLAAGATLQLDYTTASPAAAVRAVLDAGDDNGFASGKIRSTGLSDGLIIGYGDDGVGRVTLRVTRPGDSDLDGDVDFTDFVSLQSGFGTTNARFDQGDYDFDGTVTFSDFVILQSNFGSRVSGRGVAASATETSALRSFAAATAVPETEAVGALAAMASALVRRRRR